MAKFVAFFVAVLAFHAVLAAPKKNQGGDQKNQVEEVITQVQSVVTDVSTSLQKVLPDEKQFQQSSQQFVSDVENIIQKLQAQIEKNKGASNDVLKEVTAKLTENINSLKQAVGPDATAKAAEIRTQLDDHFKNSAAEVEKLVKIVQPNLEQAGETVNTFAKGILDDFLKAATDLKTHVDSAIEDNTRTLKKKH